MRRTFYVIYDSNYFTGEKYSHAKVELDGYDITEEDVLNKLNELNPDPDDGCDINLWKKYNTFYKIFEDISEYSDDDFSYIDSFAVELAEYTGYGKKTIYDFKVNEDEMDEDISYRFREARTHFTDILVDFTDGNGYKYDVNSYYYVNEQIEIITDYYNEAGCEDDDHAFSKLEYRR